MQIFEWFVHGSTTVIWHTYAMEGKPREKTFAFLECKPSAMAQTTPESRVELNAFAFWAQSRIANVQISNIFCFPVGIKGIRSVRLARITENKLIHILQFRFVGLVKNSNRVRNAL